ncbi:MAG: 4-hydroxy-tetrahydrodipicolinate synthase [Ruminococcaceae bacterium]|nr:4-hydroxy-tetrahydrodipicolinate synthase [Oscillospiraceae bacterium]
MKKTIFTGAGVAIVTPFNKDLSVNYDKLGELIEYQIKNNTDAIIICGTTGEASTLTDDEHKDCIRFAVEKVAGRVPVIAGTGSNDTAYAIELTRYAKEVGADAYLNVTPYYNKTTQRGLIKHFTAIADAVELPAILYNVPGRTGMTIAPETYKELCKHPNIVATKEASGKVDDVVRIRDLCGDDLDIYSGEDGLITPMLSLGAKGVISVLSNIKPQETHDICETYFRGNISASAALQIKYSKLIDALFCETNPIPVKAALNILGFDVGECRLPLYEMGEANLARIKAAIEDVK